MPKIPLYNQGLGQTVTTKPIQGVRANEGAFTASQKGFSAFGGAIEDAAFKFGMEEKKAETDRYRNKVNTDVNQEMNNFTMNSEATTVAEYQALADKKRIELRNKHLSGLEGKLTKNQFRDVSMQFDNTFAAKVATGSQQAHNKHQAIRTEQVNTTVDDTLSQLRSLDPSSQLYQDIQTGLDEGFDRWASQGIRPKYSKTTYRRELSASRFVNDAKSATSQTDIDKLRSNLEAEKGNMTAPDYAARNTAIDAQEKITDTMQVEAAYQTIFENKPDATDEQLAGGIQTIRDGKVLTITTNAGEDVVVDFSNMKTANREMLVLKIEARNKTDKLKARGANLLAFDTKIASATLAELKEMKNNVSMTEDGTQNTPHVVGPEIKEFSDRQTLKGLINAAIGTKAKEAVAEAQQTLRSTQAALVASDDGFLTQTQQDAADQAVAKLRNAGELDAANKMEVELSAMQIAGQKYRGIEFSSFAAQQVTLNDVEANRGSEEGARVHALLKERILNRNKELKDDFVGYYNEKKPNQPLTPEEMINLQLKMGVPPGEVRVTSNSDLTTFLSQYNAEGNTSINKAEILDQFVQSAGPDHETRIMRHLMSKNIISFSEHLRAVYPEQINMQTIVDGNEEANIKNFKDKLESTQRNEIDGIVRDTVNSYTSSVMGGITDGVVGVGGDSKRTAHIIAMQDTIGNAAKHLMATRDIDAQEAVDIAYDAVIGDHFKFEDINGSQLRVPVVLAERSEDISTVLQHSAFKDQEYLKSRIVFPPTPEGKNDDDFQNEFLQDLKNNGSWRTTVDNKGAFLVDQLGNLVPMKPSEDFVPPDDVEGFGGFVSVPFSSVLPLADEYADTRGNRLDVMNKIFENKKLF